MDKEQIKLLIKKYLNGTATTEESAFVETWYNGFTEQEGNMPAAKVIIAVDRIGKRLKLDRSSPAERKKAIPLWPRMRVAAMMSAATVLLALGVWIFNNYWQTSVPENQKISYHNDILPGKNGARLTFSNGKVIKLKSTKAALIITPAALTYSDGTAAGSKDAGGDKTITTLNSNQAIAITAQTEVGQTYVFILPDGTKVWLNASSRLNFPSSFSKQAQRIVELEGEGYFEVAKNKNQPFLVRTKVHENHPGQEITVLGTHFNVNAYADEHGVTTTLLEGRVKIAVPGLKSDGAEQPAGVTLQPNQQSVLLSNRQFQVTETDTQKAVAWKNGYFSFHDESIQSVMRSVSRWYNVEINYQGNITNDRFTAKISRYKNISQILTMLAETKLVHFKVEGRRVTITE